MTIFLDEDTGERYKAVQYDRFKQDWCLTLIPKEYRLGQIVLVATGDRREQKDNEFFLYRGVPAINNGAKSKNAIILKPIRIEED